MVLTAATIYGVLAAGQTKDIYGSRDLETEQRVRNYTDGVKLTEQINTLGIQI